MGMILLSMSRLLVFTPGESRREGTGLIIFGYGCRTLCHDNFFIVKPDTEILPLLEEFYDFSEHILLINLHVRTSCHYTAIFLPENY